MRHDLPIRRSGIGNLSDVARAVGWESCVRRGAIHASARHAPSATMRVCRQIDPMKSTIDRSTATTLWGFGSGATASSLLTRSRVARSAGDSLAARCSTPWRRWSDARQRECRSSSRLRQSCSGGARASAARSMATKSDSHAEGDTGGGEYDRV